MDESEISHLEKYSTKEIMLFENKISDLFFEIAAEFTGNVKSTQMMRDDDFVHRNDRKTNDIHLFLELKDGNYFHLRAYTRHMLEAGQTSGGQIFLTGYEKNGVDQTGGNHTLKQDWYEWDAKTIVQEIIKQNPEKFS